MATSPPSQKVCSKKGALSSHQGDLLASQSRLQTLEYKLDVLLAYTERLEYERDQAIEQGLAAQQLIQHLEAQQQQTRERLMAVVDHLKHIEAATNDE